jgi:8-oxo-dGTP diphosphatase
VTYRDSSGRTLEDYPRPSVAVDTAVLTISKSQLSVLLTLTNDAARGGPEEWRLPGSFVHPGEKLVDAALRSLRDKAGVEGLAPRQLHVFDDPDRDDRGWVMSVAHYDVVPVDRLTVTDRVRLVPVDELPSLKYDHATIVAFAVEALRADYRRSPDPARLLEQPFTMRSLRHLHDAVLGEQQLPDTFRRSMLPGLEPTGDVFSEGRGRPAELYRRSKRAGRST